MTRDEAIKDIEKQYEAGVRGFMVESMDEEDIDMYCDDDIKERYQKMTDVQKEQFMSRLMDEFYGMLEEGRDYGFGRILMDTIENLELEDRMDEVIDGDVPDMTEQQAEENDVVAARCCVHCAMFDNGHCKTLGCKTYETDVCGEYTSRWHKDKEKRHGRDTKTTRLVSGDANLQGGDGTN